MEHNSYLDSLNLVLDAALQLDETDAHFKLPTSDRLLSRIRSSAIKPDIGTVRLIRTLTQSPSLFTYCRTAYPN